VLGVRSSRCTIASEDARAVAMALLASGRVPPSQAALLGVRPRGLAAVPASSPGWPASGPFGATMSHCGGSSGPSSTNGRM
jgi:hypothetical protein